MKDIKDSITETLIERGIEPEFAGSTFSFRTWNQAEAQVNAVLHGGDTFDEYYIRYGAIPSFTMDEDLFERGQSIQVEDIRDGMFVFGEIDKRGDDGEWSEECGKMTFGQIRLSAGVKGGAHIAMLNDELYHWQSRYNYCGGEADEDTYTQLYFAKLRIDGETT